MSKFYIPLAAAALIIVISLGQVGQAHALAGMSFTSKPTFTSQSATRFQTVYISQDGTGTYFIDSNTTKITINKVNSTGSITYTRAISLQGTGVSGISKVEYNNTSTWIYAVQSRGSQIFTIARYDINTGTQLKIANMTASSSSSYTVLSIQSVIETRNVLYWVYGASAGGGLFAADASKDLRQFGDFGGLLDSNGGAQSPAA